MAVPPADDGELTRSESEVAEADRTEEESARSTPTSRPGGISARSLLVLSAVLAVVVVVCLVVLGLRFARDTDPDDGTFARAGSVLDAGDAEEVQAEREEVMRQGRQFVLRVFTYGPDDLEGDQMPGYVEGVTDLITPKFAVDFEENAQLAAQPVAQAGYGRTAEAGLVGVRDLGNDAATVMVSGTFTSSYPAAQEGQPRQQTDPVPLRLLVSLVRTDGRWLVDDFVPVTTGADEGDGTADPTQPTPTTPAPTQGQQGQGQGQTQGGGS